MKECSGMRKETRKYYFTVEGEREKWYFEWLQKAINETSTAIYAVKFDCQIQKYPLKRAKGLTLLGKTEITHVTDRESEDAIHVKQFEDALSQMKEAERLGKDIKYQLGYSNFSFEIWIILHKADCNGALAHRRQYLSPLNRAYEENFENLDQYKHETNFKRILSKITLEDVVQAIRRSKYISQSRKENGHVLRQYKGYQYYSENPSLSVWETIERILQECGII
jgi:hypothetical protein